MTCDNRVDGVSEVNIPGGGRIVVDPKEPLCRALIDGGDDQPFCNQRDCYGRTCPIIKFQNGILTQRLAAIRLGKI